MKQSLISPTLSSKELQDEERRKSKGKAYTITIYISFQVGRVTMAQVLVASHKSEISDFDYS